MRPRALIADDEPQLLRSLARQLATAWPDLQVVHCARHGLEAAERIAALEPDIAFLDIQMPGLTGLEVAQGIEGPTRVVFVTAYDEFAVQAFEAEAIDYLLKPVDAARLERAVERLRRALSPLAEDGRLLAALQRLTPRPSAPPLRWIRASSGAMTHHVAVDEVMYFRADDKYTTVRTRSGEEHLIRTPIVELAAQLDPGQFVQMHRSTIVNLSFAAGTRRDEASRLFLVLKGSGEELPVSRAYVHLFKAL